MQTVPVAPTHAPNFARGAALYAEHCASCHGISGDGAGPAATSLKPPPIAFTDASRARQRSIFALYQVIEQGLDGTSMVSFASLSPDDRWALALYVSAFAFPEPATPSGERIWNEDSQLRAALGPEQFISATPTSLTPVLGEERLDTVIAYLRRHPAEVFMRHDSSLTLARTRVAEALSAYDAGHQVEAERLALAAYLDGFEPLEPLLATRNKTLLAQIEGSMGALRASIAGSASSTEVRKNADAVVNLFVEAERLLASGKSSGSASFAGAFTILFREGLEALLIVTAMVALLRKADMKDALRYVHAGWAVALLAGVGTWAVATTYISVSGASRELTEGFGSLLAGLVLLWVGIWMHGKGQADAWQRYIGETMNRALGQKSAWFLFALSFVAVYREVFETILFYAAIWDRGQGHAVVGGAALAAVALALVAALLLRYSRRLPIGKFFAYSSLIMALLAVVLIGKSIAALQEAGNVPLDPIVWAPRIDLLGLFPTVEGVLAQVVTIALLIIAFVRNGRAAQRRLR